MDTPSWSDLFTPEELATVLELQGARLAKQFGDYSLAADIKCAADCIRELAEKASHAEALHTKLVALERHVDAGLETLISKLQ
jgi:hypothetical protein